MITEGCCAHAHSHVNYQVSAEKKIQNRVYGHAEEHRPIVRQLLLDSLHHEIYVYRYY